jgi:galactonate dehydratase
MLAATEVMKIAAERGPYVDLMPHNPLGPICTAATVHFGAAVANFSWLECRASPAEKDLGFDDSEVFPVQIRLHGAVYPVPDTPGLGVEVDEARLVRDSFRYWEAPHLRRRDGSFTNW